MKRNARARLAATDPATLASLHRQRIDSRDPDPAAKEYVHHWYTCKQCHVAVDGEGLCPHGKHLYSKLSRQEDGNR